MLGEYSCSLVDNLGELSATLPLFSFLQVYNAVIIRGYKNCCVDHRMRSVNKYSKSYPEHYWLCGPGKHAELVCMFTGFIKSKDALGVA